MMWELFILLHTKQSDHIKVKFTKFHFDMNIIDKYRQDLGYKGKALGLLVFVDYNTQTLIVSKLAG